MQGHAAVGGGAGLPGFLLLVGLWWGMLGATMLPTTWPWLVGLARLARPSGAASRGNRDDDARGSVFDASRVSPATIPVALPVAFATGYLTIWLGFSFAAAALQMLLTPSTATSPLLASGLLAVAGAYQLTPLKHACLQRCRSPLSAMLLEWPPRASHALRIGLSHGLFCLGCCWALMLIGVATGASGWIWMAGLTPLVAVEKLTRPGPRVARAAGLVLLALAVLAAG
jgi:predicted metal-binding membrane protein